MYSQHFLQCFVLHALLRIGSDALSRIQFALGSSLNLLIAAVGLLPVAYAQTPELDNNSTLVPPDGSIDFAPTHNDTISIQRSVAWESGWFNIQAWDQRGRDIRSGSTKSECLGNLTYAISTLGALSSAEYGGAAGALSLLPTAGALIGSPTREMWVLYKLMPLAGFLSMLLSLGGNITPSKAGEYDPSRSFDYGGMMPNTYGGKYDDEIDKEASNQVDNSGRRSRSQLSEAQLFAQKVKLRAQDDAGGDSYGRVWLAITIQFFLIGVILIAMYFGQLGGVITWWCKVWGWMYFWYFLVTVTSLFDNLIAAPFTKNYKLRICKASTNINVSEDTPRVTDHPKFSSALDALNVGINIDSSVTIGPSVSAFSRRTYFYVVISIEGISAGHAVAQIVSKSSTAAVFAFGTALFASAQLMSISAALMVLTLMISSGVLGRVIAMWIASELFRHNNAILHTVVKTHNEARDFVEEIMRIDDLQIEIDDHVIHRGYVILRRSKWAAWATYIGLLARPFNMVKHAREQTGLPYMRECGIELSGREHVREGSGVSWFSGTTRFPDGWNPSTAASETRTA